ncbi:MAG: VacJ family lipoprotein [Gammaproteobacteria bacterium]|nr:VacJ family lipoprotein [Pseudomonadota bacterium]MCH9662463.1 VacJ family lipoprotein [Gammaproteobacteria bacterium]
METISRIKALNWIVLSALLLCSCSGRQELIITDPYEASNRELLKSVRKTDENITRPIATFYNNHLNSTVKNGIRNIVDNIETSNYAVNDLLQLRMHRFFHDSARLIINSTAGLLGMIDVASHLDLKPERNDFGKTLAHWGWHSSAMVIIPVYANSTVRDFYGNSIEYLFIHPIRFLNMSAPERIIYELFKGVYRRIDLFSIDSVLNDPSVIDQYDFIRQYYRQSRIVMIQRHGEEVQTEVIWSEEELDLLD